MHYCGTFTEEAPHGARRRLHLSQEPVSWDRVEWRQGDGRYTFQLASGGLLATLTSPHGAKLTLPMVAWEGLLDALAAQRKTRTRTESKFPARSGARWYDGEAGELAAAFKAGRSIRQLARAHSRSEHRRRSRARPPGPVGPRRAPAHATRRAAAPELRPAETARQFPSPPIGTRLARRDGGHAIPGGF